MARLVLAAPEPARSAPGPASPRRWLTGLLLVGLGGAILVSPLIGNVPIPPGIGLAILTHELSAGVLAPAPCPGLAGTTCAAFVAIIWQARFPEVLLALLAGAALGLSGGALQGLFRNPLADPFLLGLSSGGTLGAALVVVFQVGLGEQDLLLPFAAFLGSLATGLAIWFAARRRFGSVETLLLTGVALSSFLSSVLSLLLLYNPYGSLQVDFWLLGNIGSATWAEDGILLGVLLIAGTLLASLGRELNVVQLGAEVAQSLGVDLRRVRLRLLLLTSVTTAVAVAFTGIIGFVGLVSPHIVRRLLGSDYRKVLPGAALVGGLFLLGARDLSLVVFPASLLPIGIFTSFAGAPFFAYLLYRRRGLTTVGGA